MCLKKVIPVLHDNGDGTATVEWVEVEEEHGN